MDKLIKMAWYLVLAVLLISFTAGGILAVLGGAPEVVGVMAGTFSAFMFWVMVVLYIVKFVFLKNVNRQASKSYE